jgi:methylated-DNA-[protein]-cysteine S-methyltransferase
MDERELIGEFHMVHFTVLDSPIGPLLLVSGPAGLMEIRFTPEGETPAPAPEWQHNSGICEDVIRQLQEYFAGQRQVFDLPLDPHGTPFQRQVWAALQSIPYGETISYAELARRIGKTSAVRAVGAANGQNPLPIVIPCHRVIGSDGSLTGYGGGLPIKRFLLDLERQTAGHVNDQLVLL